MTTTANYPDNPPMVLKQRRTKKRPFPPHRLRKGWRWRTSGEMTAMGDLCCDPRIMPVKIVREWRMTKGCHPVQTPKYRYA